MRPLDHRARRRLLWPALAGSVLLVAAAPAGQPGHEPKPAPRPPAAKKPGPSAPARDPHHSAPAPANAPQAPEARGPAGEAPGGDEPAAPPTAESALRLLREGNERWVADEPIHPSADAGRRRAAAEEGQRPFATVLTCADSRLPVERLFDRGVGELFVVRVAGNVVTPEEAGTVEYGAHHLHVPLVVVMGHTRCGAVQAAAEGARPGGNIDALLARIAPAVERARRLDARAQGPELAAAAVRENVWQSIFDLVRSSSAVRERIAAGELRVEGAVCDVATGRVEWLGEHPWQSALVEAFQSRDDRAQAGEPSQAEPAGAHAGAPAPGGAGHDGP